VEEINTKQIELQKTPANDSSKSKKNGTSKPASNCFLSYKWRRRQQVCCLQILTKQQPPES